MTKRILLAIVLAAGGAFMLSAGRLSKPAPNPPLHPELAIEAALTIPPNVAESMRKACRNCHSNQTVWPWYSRVPPASWMVARDVRKARRAMNLSEWPSHGGKNRLRAGATLMAACTSLRSGRMPLAGYKLLHPESRLSQKEVETFCEWATAESMRLLAHK